MTLLFILIVLFIGAVLTLSVLISLAFLSMIALVLAFIYYLIEGEWPSAHAVMWIAGLFITGLLYLLYPHVAVLIGGLIGTWIAARTAHA